MTIVGNMFERYTERARQVVILAQDTSRKHKHGYTGTEHILMGLLREEGGLAARVLDSLDITVEHVEQRIVEVVGTGPEVVSGMIPFTPRAKKVLELALREALSLGHNYIGTEHILLGLVRENEGVAARILLDADVDAEKIRNEIFRMLSGPGKLREQVAKATTLGEDYEKMGARLGELSARLGELKNDQLITVLTGLLTEATKYLKKLNTE